MVLRQFYTEDRDRAARAEHREQGQWAEQQGQSIENRDSGQSSKGRAASFQWIAGRAARTDEQGQSSKFSVVEPTEIEELSIKQRVSFGQRF